MTARVLDKAEWQTFFDRMAKGLEGRRAHAEVGGLDLGEQVAVESAPLLGISYEPKADLLEIAMEGVDHMIRAPRRIAVEETGAGLSGLEVVDAEDRRQVVRLTEPLKLPAPS
ncbi:MAG: DUF5335 family protein [Pseudomonadota bacterium]